MFEGSGGFEDDEEFARNYTWVRIERNNSIATTPKVEDTTATVRRNAEAIAPRSDAFETTKSPNNSIIALQMDEENDKFFNEIVLLVLFVICLLTFLLVIGIICYLCRIHCRRQARKRQGKQNTVQTVVEKSTSMNGLHTTYAQYDQNLAFKNDALSPVSLCYSSQHHQVNYIPISKERVGHGSSHLQTKAKMRKHSTPVPLVLYRDSVEEKSLKYDPLVMTVVTPQSEDNGSSTDIDHNDQPQSADHPESGGSTNDSSMASEGRVDGNTHSEMYNTAKSELAHTGHENSRTGHANEIKPLLNQEKEFGEDYPRNELKLSQSTQPVSWFVPLDGVTHEPLRHSFIDLSDNNMSQHQNFHINAIDRDPSQWVHQDVGKRKAQAESKKKKTNSETDADSLIQENSGSSSENLPTQRRLDSVPLSNNVYISSLSEDSGWKGEEFWEFDDDDKCSLSPSHVSPLHPKSSWEVRESRTVVATEISSVGS